MIAKERLAILGGDLRQIVMAGALAAQGGVSSSAAFCAAMEAVEKACTVADELVSLAEAAGHEIRR